MESPPQKRSLVMPTGAWAIDPAKHEESKCWSVHDHKWPLRSKRSTPTAYVLGRAQRILADLSTEFRLLRLPAYSWDVDKRYPAKVALV